jgi:hypothetical protein
MIRIIHILRDEASDFLIFSKQRLMRSFLHFFISFIMASNQETSRFFYVAGSRNQGTVSQEKFKSRLWRIGHTAHTALTAYAFYFPVHDSLELRVRNLSGAACTLRAA